MLCDGCEEVSLGEGLAYGECVFCSEPCFEEWFAGARAAQRTAAVAATQRARPEARTALSLVAVTVVAAGALLASGQGPAQARLFDRAFEPPAVAAAATCHKRRVIGGQRKRITVACRGRRFTDPRTAPHPA
jgi:hypothetical protein